MGDVIDFRPKKERAEDSSQEELVTFLQDLLEDYDPKTATRALASVLLYHGVEYSRSESGFRSWMSTVLMGLTELGVELTLSPRVRDHWRK